MAVSCSLLNPLFKETKDDWYASGSSQTNGTSISIRPDALSIDCQTAFSYGPIETGSLENGLINKVWKVNVLNSNNTGSVFLARENDSGNNWRQSSLLFNYDSTYPIIELDLSFSADGRALVSAERITGSPSILSGSEVWLYWFNPLESNFIFQNFGPGQNPRVILDSPDTPDNSDILLLYVKNSVGQVYYRQQRDLYSVEQFIPLPIPSSVSGTLEGALSGSMIGCFTGSASGSFSPFLSGNFQGILIGTGSGNSTGSIFEIRSDVFNGYLLGSISGTLSGSLVGTLNGNVVSGSSAMYSGSIFGTMSGSLSGSYNGEAYRIRTYPFYGSFIGKMSGSGSGSFTGTTDNAVISTNLSGYMSGSLTGSLAGDIYGIPLGIQTAYYETYLEDAVKLRDSRIRIYYSLRNVLNHSYDIRTFETVLYPVGGMLESYNSSVTLNTGQVIDKVITKTIDPDIIGNFGLTFITSSLKSVVNSYTVSTNDTDHLSKFSLTFLTASLMDFVISKKVYLNTSDYVSNFTLNFVTSSLKTVVIQQNLNDNNDSSLIKNLTLISGSLG